MSHNNSRSRKRASKNGKRTGNKNALGHGVYAKDLLLPWESREDFERLFAEIYLELRPDGCLEKEFVLDIAHFRWQKRRIQKLWHAAVNDDPFVKDLVRSGKKSWSGITGFLRSQGESLSGVTQTIGTFCLELIAAMNEMNAEMLESKYKKADFEKTQKKVELIRELIGNSLVPLMQMLNKGPSAEATLRHVYSPEYLEPILRLEAMIDARIDKHLAKLVTLQEYKRLRELHGSDGNKILELQSERK